MSHLDVTAERYTLHVSSRQILDNLLADYDRGHGDMLVDALSILTHRSFLVSPAGIGVTQDMAMADRSDDLPYGVRMADDFTGLDVFRALIEQGYLSSWVNVWTEREGTSYVDDDLVVTGLTVSRAFTVTPVMYHHGPGINYATRATVDTNRAVTVPAGNYVLTERGSMHTGLGFYGAGFLGTDPLPTTEGIAEDVNVSVMWAGCDTCDGRWFAESGSWHFHADYMNVPADWWYDGDDMEWTEDGRLRCPYDGRMRGEDNGRCSGHLTFMAS